MASKVIYIAKKVIPWMVSIIILVFLFGKLHLGSLPEMFKNADLSLLALSLVISLIYYFSVSVKKYKYLLEFFGIHLSEEEARLIRIGSMPLKAIVPYKAGEFLRAVYLKRLHNVPYQKGVFLIVLGYVTRLPVLLFIALIGVLLLHTGIKAYLILLFCSFLLTSVIFLDKKYKYLVFHSILSELLLIANYIIIFKAFNINIPGEEILLFVPLILVLTGLPVSIMGIGIREAVVAAFFVSRADFNTLLFSALSVSLTESVIPLFLSTVFLKKFISNMAINKRAAESFDPETYFQRRNNNFLTRYRLKRRIKEVIDTMSKYCRKKDISVLDIGAADGIMLSSVYSGLNVKKAVGIELSKELIEHKKSDKIEIIQGKSENLPFGASEFDVVLMCSVIEHVENVEKTLNEAYKVLRENGHLVLTTVNGFFDKIASIVGIKPDDHLRTYTVGELKEILIKHGFEIIEMKSFGPLFYNIIVAEKPVISNQ